MHIQLQMTFLSLVKMIPSKMLSRKMSKVPYVDHMLPKDGLGQGQSKVEAI